MTATTKTHTPATTTVHGGKRKPPADPWTYQHHDGTRRLVAVGVDVTGVWFVFDIPTVPGERTALLVERLAGFDDKLSQATALAGEYLRCQQEFHRGLREEFTCPDPLPKPRRIALRLVAVALARARAAAARGDRLHLAGATGDPGWFDRVLALAAHTSDTPTTAADPGNPPRPCRRERTTQ